MTGEYSERLSGVRGLGRNVRNGNDFVSGPVMIIPTRRGTESLPRAFGAVNFAARYTFARIIFARIGGALRHGQALLNASYAKPGGMARGIGKRIHA